MNIRPFTPQDQPQVVRLLVDLQDHIARLDPLRMVRSREGFDGQAYFQAVQKQIGSRSTLLVAEDAGQVVGVIAASVMERSEKNSLEMQPYVPRAGRVFELIVDTSQRGKGVGKKLLQAAEEFLKSQGCGLAELGCLATNTDTLDFYMRHGYIKHWVDLSKKI